MQKYKLFYWIISILGGLLLLFVAAPLLNMFLETSPQSLVDTAADPEVSGAIARSLLLAMVATLFFGMFAIPLAWLMARYDFPLKRLVSGLIDVPVMIPHSAAGIAVLGILNRDSFIGGFAGRFGIDFVDRPAGIVVAMAFVSLPFLINGYNYSFSRTFDGINHLLFSLVTSMLKRHFFPIPILVIGTIVRKV